MKRIGPILLLIFLAPALSSAVENGIVQTVGDDLQPVRGTVLQHLDGQYLIDLDAADGVRVGDLLAVVRGERNVVHPRTGVVVGRLAGSVTVLRVARVKSGFSIAEPPSDQAPVEVGDEVARYAHMSALLTGPSGRGKDLYERLRKALPQFEWQGFFAATEQVVPDVDLVFSLADDYLQLTDADGTPLRSWRLDLAGASPGMPAPATAGQIPELTESGQKEADDRRSPFDFGPFEPVDSFPDRVLMASCFRDDGTPVVATVDGARLRVFRVGPGLREVASVQVGEGGVRPVYVSWWSSGRAQPLRLVVTAVDEISRNSGRVTETRLVSAIYAFDETGLTPLVTGIGYFLGTFDRDGDGRPETLLGQEFDPEYTFGEVRQLEIEEGRVTAREVAFALPRQFRVVGSTMVDLTGNGEPEIAQVSRGDIVVYSGREQLYRSTASAGGSLSGFSYDVNPELQDTMFKVIALEVPPAAEDVDGDGNPELFVITSETSPFRVPGLGPGVRTSRIMIVAYRDGYFQKGSLAGERENPLQGLWVNAGSLYLVETAAATGENPGQSRLLARSLK